jgi:hypothetical protein
MVMNKASGRDSPLQQGAEKSSWILPISRRRRWRLAVCFEEKRSGSLGFSRRGEYIGERGRQRVDQLVSPLVARARGRPRHPRVSLAPAPPMSHLRTS